MELRIIRESGDSLVVHGVGEVVFGTTGTA